MKNRQKVYVRIKSILDIFLGWLGVFILLPLILIVGLIIKWDSKGPIFFRQRRIGKNKQVFIILKFRTMFIDTPKNVPTHQMKDPNQWITRVGKFLRKTSLDEIPQIFNIARGHMSFIGPRPALWNQNDLVNERDIHGVNDLVPGITGYAQVHGRDALTIKEKAKFDGIYVQKVSLFTDIWILLKTIKAVFKKEGVVEGGTHTLKKSEDSHD